jgi:hypothetical protein
MGRGLFEIGRAADTGRNDQQADDALPQAPSDRQTFRRRVR